VCLGRGEVLPASREELTALMSDTHCWRDRLLVVLILRSELHRGEAVNLFQQDLLLVCDAREPG
jgi:hypothetical protein